jgi:hypothetical protein
MDKFVCVRVVKANRMDLTLFQFDFDLTFAIFFMNADKTIYGRYGTRSERKEANKDISLEGLRETMAAVLTLHQKYPASKPWLAGKRPTSSQYKTPEDYPLLRDKYKAELDYGGNVVQSCMHCHQIREAERQVYRAAREPIPDEVLFPWPMPDVLGLSMNPQQRATVASVARDSTAERAGFQAGDELVVLGGQAIASTADIQWVLHTAKSPDEVEAIIKRDGQPKSLTLQLDDGWRRRGDISWRVTTWDLRRMGTGGLKLEDLAAAERDNAGLAADRLALLVQHVGQYGPHAAAKRAGFQKGDIIVELDGSADPMRETDLLAYVLQKHLAGSSVPVTVLRGGKNVKLMLPTQ